MWLDERFFNTRKNLLARFEIPKKVKIIAPYGAVKSFRTSQLWIGQYWIVFYCLWVIILNLSTKSFKAFWTSLKICISSPKTVFVTAPIYDLRKREHVQKGQTPKSIVCHNHNLNLDSGERDRWYCL